MIVISVYDCYKCLTLSLPDQSKPVPLLCLTPDDFTCQGRASGWERIKIGLRDVLNNRTSFYATYNFDMHDGVLHTDDCNNTTSPRIAPNAYKMSAN